MKKSAHVSLRDILDTIDAAIDMTAEVDFAADLRNMILRLAVERCVEIISEASRRFPADAKARFPGTPWPEIAAIGNLLRHEYQRVDDHIIWRLATRDLPLLRPTILRLLESDG